MEFCGSLHWTSTICWLMLVDGSKEGTIRAYGVQGLDTINLIKSRVIEAVSGVSLLLTYQTASIS